MSNGRQPDPQTRFASHLLVGLAVGSVAGKKSGLFAFAFAAIASVLAHEVLDAPVAQLLTDLGA
jgi:Na+/H+ antiporter NhaA